MIALMLLLPAVGAALGLRFRIFVLAPVMLLVGAVTAVWCRIASIRNQRRHRFANPHRCHHCGPRPSDYVRRAAGTVGWPWRHRNGCREPAAGSDGVVAEYRRLGAGLRNGASAVGWLITLALVLVLDPFAAPLTVATSRGAG